MKDTMVHKFCPHCGIELAKLSGVIAITRGSKYELECASCGYTWAVPKDVKVATIAYRSIKKIEEREEIIEKMIEEFSENHAHLARYSIVKLFEIVKSLFALVKEKK